MDGGRNIASAYRAIPADGGQREVACAAGQRWAAHEPSGALVLRLIEPIGKRGYTDMGSGP